MNEATPYLVGRLSARDLPSLARLRARHGWECRNGDGGDDWLWLRVPPEDEAEFARLPLLGRWRMELPDLLVRWTRKVPEARLPMDGWKSLLQVLGAVPPERGAEGMLPLPVGFSLVEAPAYREADGLLTTWSRFAEWAESVLLARLECLEFARGEGERVFLRGRPLPGVPGTGYYRIERFWLPCGLALPDWLPPGLLARVIEPAEGQGVIFHPDGGHEILADEHFVRGDRAAVRTNSQERSA